MLRRRGRFADLIARQLDLFQREHAELLRECEDALAAYDRADRDEAEELYGDYVDLVETGTELLADARDTYATTLDADAGDEYELAFNRAVARTLPPFGLEIENR
jgi:hypothetical protein